MKYYYKKSNGKVVELKQLHELWWFFSKNIVELILPDGCEKVWYHNNQLKVLIIPDGCEEVEADMISVNVLNKVEELYLTI